MSNTGADWRATSGQIAEIPTMTLDIDPAVLCLEEGEEIQMVCTTFNTRPYHLVTGILVSVFFAIFTASSTNFLIAFLPSFIVGLSWLALNNRRYVLTNKRLGMITGWRSDQLTFRSIPIAGASATTGVGRMVSARSTTGERMVFRWMTWKDSFDMVHAISQWSQRATLSTGRLL